MNRAHMAYDQGHHWGPSVWAGSKALTNQSRVDHILGLCQPCPLGNPSPRKIDSIIPPTGPKPVAGYDTSVVFTGWNRDPPTLALAQSPS